MPVIISEYSREEWCNSCFWSKQIFTVVNSPTSEICHLNYATLKRFGFNENFSWGLQVRMIALVSTINMTNAGTKLWLLGFSFSHHIQNRRQFTQIEINLHHRKTFVMNSYSIVTIFAICFYFVFSSGQNCNTKYGPQNYLSEIL